MHARRWGVITECDGTPDLFGHTNFPAGFAYLPDAITADLEQELIASFERLPFTPFQFHSHLAKRRIYTFGHRYVFAGQKPRQDASIPDYLVPLINVASRISGQPAKAFEQAMITEYPPGAGIGWHRDRPTFGDIVAISFGAPCVLRLRRRDGDRWERRSVTIDPRSAYLLHGTARNVWQHSVLPVAALRHSVTMRTFRSGHGASDLLG
jgi:alkylated DNA repair dioxygenase AlkB